MSLPPSSRESQHNEQIAAKETINLNGLEASQNTPHCRDEKRKQDHSEEAVESIHDVSISTSRDEDEVASSIEDNDLRDVEASISEPAYTVFTRSHKRFIALLAACAGFFSAVSFCAEYDRNIPLTLLGFCKHIFSSSQFADQGVRCLADTDQSNIDDIYDRTRNSTSYYGRPS
jgi:hypothetical protein